MSAFTITYPPCEFCKENVQPAVTVNLSGPARYVCGPCIWWALCRVLVNDPRPSSQHKCDSPSDKHGSGEKT